MNMNDLVQAQLVHRIPSLHEMHPRTAKWISELVRMRFPDRGGADPDHIRADRPEAGLSASP